MIRICGISRAGFIGFFSIVFLIVFSNNVLAVDDLQFSVSVNSPVGAPEAVIDNALQSFCPDLLAGNESATSQLRDVCEFITGDTPGTPAQIKVALEELSAKPNSSATTVVATTPPIKYSPSIGLRLSALRRSSKRNTFTAFRAPVYHATSRAQASEQKNSQEEPGGLLSQRLSGFVNLAYADAKQHETNTEIGFDSNLQSITAGADYRLRSSTFIGIAPQFNNLAADLTDADSNLSARQMAFTAYGTHFVRDNWYVEGTVSWGRQFLNLKRFIDFDTNTTQVNVTADGNTTSDQYSVSGGTGVDFTVWENITGVISATVVYSSSTIDSYVEKDAGNFNLNVDQQAFDSLTSRVSGYISQVHSTKWGVLVPQLHVSWIHENVDNGEAITARFASNPVTSFSFTTKAPDPNYFIWGIDLQLVMPMGRSVFVSATNLQRFRDRSEASVNAGFRMELQR